MTIYFALWIPTKKEGRLQPLFCPDRKVVCDCDSDEPYFLWGEVDKRSLDFTLRYSGTDEYKTAKTLTFKREGHHNHWFIVYSVEISDKSTSDSFLHNIMQSGLSPSVYNFIKAHFHKHQYHDEHEDALLLCMRSDVPVSLKSDTERGKVASHYLDQYADKFDFLLKIQKEYHARARALVNGEKSTGKGIGMYTEMLRKGRETAGEFEYCEFLMQHYTAGRKKQNQHIRETMAEFHHELEEITFDYQLCTNAHNIKLAHLGIFFGVVGIVVSAGGIIHSCCSENESSAVIRRNQFDILQGEKAIQGEIRNLHQQVDSLRHTASQPRPAAPHAK